MTPTQEQTEQELERRRAAGQRPSGGFFALYAQDKTAVLALAMIVALALYCLVAPFAIDPSESRIDPSWRLSPPTVFSPGEEGRLLGSDHLGRSLILMVALGLRTSLGVTLVVVSASALIGWSVGAFSAYVGGRIDDLGGRFMDLANAFPGLLLAIALVTALGPSARSVALVLIVVSWVTYGRVTRAQVLSLKSSDFVQAAMAYGSAPSRVVRVHIGRATRPMILTIALVEMPSIMLGEASLSFLGFGVQPPQVSLGLLVAEARQYIQINPWALVFPGAVLALACSSTALVGLRVRRITDPGDSFATS